MARRRKSSSVGVGGILIILALGLIITRPLIGIVVLLGVIVIAALTAKPSRCEVCGNILKRSKHVWQLGEKKVSVCPHCNQRLAREKSRAAFKRR